MARSLTVLIAGGSGTIGSQLATELRNKNHKVYILSRNPSAIDTIEWKPGVDAFNLDDIVKLIGNPVDVVVNLAGATISKMPWTRKTKENILESRLIATKTIVDAINTAKHKPSALINASAVGFYGNREDEMLTETSNAGEGFLVDVVTAWEKAAEMVNKQTRLVLLRTGLVLGKHGALKPLKFLTSCFISGPLAGGNQWWPWISLQDEVRAIIFAIENKKISGPVNLVGPHPATSKTLMKSLAKQMRRPFWLPVPGFAITFALGQAGRELLLSSQKVSPEVLINSGFTFLDSEISDGLHSALG